MKTILLPTDFSDNSLNAIEYALNYYKDSVCVFYLLHVNNITTVPVDEFLYTQNVLLDVNTAQTKKQLKEVLKKIHIKFPKQKHHTFYTLTDTNYFINSIRENVEENKIDVIVMGTKGASGLSKYIIGTNTGDVITKVKCTTLVVPEKAKFKPIKEVAFPTDFTLTNDLQLLKPITEILDKHKSALRVLNISKSRSELSDYQQKIKGLLEDYFYYYEHSFHFLTNRKVEEAVQCFVDSRNIDMITMVAKNLNYFQQILFHSKVEEISYHTDIPFLVLHE